MPHLAAVLLVSLLTSSSVASESCFCKPPIPAGYKSEYCCEPYSSNARQATQQPTSQRSPWGAHIYRGVPGGSWKQTFLPLDRWQGRFPRTQTETFSPDASEQWQSYEPDSEPLIMPRHAFRRRQTLDEHQKQSLEDIMLFIDDLQEFPNSTRSRRPRHTVSEPVCDPQQRYRTADGTCNSPERPLRGAAGQGTTRLVLPPAYEDHVFIPRFLDTLGRPLPGARQISLAVTTSKDVPLPLLTDSVMQWGQFIDHDLTLSPEVEPQPDSRCCHRGRRAPDAHKFCLPITAWPADPVYRRCRRTCIEFVRSVPAWEERQSVLTQLNTRTSYIDADMLYGVTDEWMRSLREGQRGRLRVGPGKLLMPDPEPEMQCFSSFPQEPCFRSGDTRVNEQARLVVMHTVWMREHNSIAARLGELNPHWDDERLFQESRRIVIAKIQRITYADWLPIVLGSNYTDANMIGEQLDTASYSSRYNSETEPTISTEFASAAFRFGHSLINDHVFLYSDLRRPPFGFTRLRDIFFAPHLVYQALDFLAKSLVAQSPQQCDLAFAGALTGHLFQERGSLCGLDLVALNIQRGRDHGVPTYASARRWCGLPRLPTFEALRVTRTMSPEAALRMAGVYRSVEDIDLFIGGVAERPIDGGLVGPTFQCLIGNQFFRLRWGDNFFYDLGGEERPWRFTLEQVAELRRASWSRVLCDAIPTISIIQPDAFRRADDQGNRLTSCAQLPEVSLDLWREE